MSPQALLLAAAAAAIVVAGAASAAGGGVQPNGAANDLLPKYGLPRGLIPDSVASYSFDEATGEFEIHLAGPATSGSAPTWFNTKRSFRGRLSYGAISNLSGIQAKKLFLWVSVTGDRRAPGLGHRRVPGRLRLRGAPGVAVRRGARLRRRRAAPRRCRGYPGAWPAPRG
ncbi:hypothetical protein OsJ_12186 [Oryza sativa Japonica Group]|uniref:Uncharacterized protein n=1 Tax=Oryza sativa subsp. japonica TaxID=39947 RepID=A3ALM5_ORYSJ|nr:hypothetical protein OsJ_12186 [Oryza sativa Japonica Group]